MIPFYVVSVLWLATLAAWQLREKQSGKERMETLKLFRAHSLTEYAAPQKTAARPTNFIQQSMQKAYDDLLGDEDD